MDLPPAKRLDGKVAIITGGASGIGAASTKLFVRHGAKVVIADINDNGAQAFIESIGAKDSVAYIHCDVSKESDVEKAVDFAVSKFGKLDIMFSNAGIPGKPIASILEANYDILKHVFEINVFGAFFCAKHAARVMIPAKKGSIIFTTSVVTANFGAESAHPYVCTKNAQVGFAKNLGTELGEHGIRVNCISPDFIPTPMGLNWLGIDKGTCDRYSEEVSNLKGAVLEDNDAAEAALFFASDASKYVSGQNLVIDGGNSTTNKGHVGAVLQKVKAQQAQQ